MSQPTCVLCAYYHPRAQPHASGAADHQTCDAGRRRLEHELLSLKAAFRRLEEEVTAEVGAKDNISRLLPGAPTSSPSNQPRVSGTKERLLPINVIRADLLRPAQTGYVSDSQHDQAGPHSVAGVLNEWVAAWHDQWYSGQRYPRMDTISLIDWMLGARLMHAAQHETGIVDFADEVRDLRILLRQVLGEAPAKRAHMWGIECPRCRIASQLTMDPEDPERYRECGNCGQMLTESEYLQHLRNLVERERRAMQ